MFKFLRFSLFCMCTVTLVKGGTITEKQPEKILSSKDLQQWFPHIMDFLELLDIGKLIGVALEYINDPEVVNFAVFLTGPEFPKLVAEFESMEEFKEAITFLESKGYDAELLVNTINSALNLPPFEKPLILWRSENGISGLLENIMAALPTEDMKELFENKLETSPEVKQLFETLNSEEFVNILKKMSRNPKFKEFKQTLESYGFDFNIICAGAKEIFGDYYQGVFCE